MQNQKHLLERNIKLFGFYKIFTKRVFLPLTTIYATQAAGLNIQQIGLIAVLSSLIGLFTDSPAGYWADNHGRKLSSQVGALLAAFGSLLYVFSTGFFGILSASLVVSLGYSFLYGSMEALIHDSLVLLNKESLYSKLASRAQSMGLIANAAFVAAVPLLYPIDKRLPFVAGFIAYLLLFVIASLLHEPKILHHEEHIKLSFIKTFRVLVNKKTALFFLCIGFIYAVGTSSNEVFNLAFIELGMPIKYLGFAFGAASILGAFVGFYIHHLKKLSFRSFAIVDFCFTIFPFIAFGIIKSLPIAIIAFILSMAMWRFEQILYQHYILEIYGSTKYKATILSLLTNFRSLQEVWMTLAITTAAKHFGILPSIGYSTILLIAFLPLFLFSIKQFTRYAKASLAS